MNCSPPGSSVHGILQARILEWVVIPFSRGLPYPGIKLGFPALQVDSLPSEALGKPGAKRKNLKAGAWDSKMTETKIPVWSWKHLLIAGRVDKLILWWVAVIICKHKLKVPKQKNLRNPSKPDLNHSDMSQQNSDLSLVFQLLLRLRNTSWLGIRETFFIEIFFQFFLEHGFPFYWLSKKMVAASLSVFPLCSSRPLWSNSRSVVSDSLRPHGLSVHGIL